MNKNDRKYDITDQQSDEKPNSIDDILELEYLTPVYHCVLSPAQHTIVLPSPALRAVFACCVHYREWSRKHHHPVLATHSQGVHHLGKDLHHQVHHLVLLPALIQVLVARLYSVQK